MACLLTGWLNLRRAVQVINRIRLFNHRKTAPLMPKSFHTTLATHKAAAGGGGGGARKKI